MDENISSNQLVQEAKSAYEEGDYLTAAHAFDAAAASFEGSDDTLSAAEMRNNSSVAYLQAGEAQLALKAVEGTSAIFAEVGDLRRQGMSLGNLGCALEAVDRHSQAADAYRQAAELLEQAGEHDLRAYVMKSLSGLQLRSGHHIEALGTMQSGLEGIEHPKPQERLLKRLLQAPFKLLSKSSDQS